MKFERADVPSPTWLLSAQSSASMVAIAAAICRVGIDFLRVNMFQPFKGYDALALQLDF